MQQQLAFVLGGGGARGALQVGALRALLESGFQPDLVVGTSAGAINAAFVATHGCTLDGIHKLAAAWREAALLDLLPANYIWITLRAMLRPSPAAPARRIRDFLIENGITPNLRFADLQGPRLIAVSSDLNAGKAILHGLSLEEGVLDAILVSTALPPWVMPVRRQGHYLMDGALVSGLPIEPALRAGATDVVALDLVDAREPFGEARGFGIFLNKLTYAVEQRQVDLELALAQARGVPVLYLGLTGPQLVPIWDFRNTDELIAQGYTIARRAIEQRGSLTLPLRASAEG